MNLAVITARGGSKRIPRKNIKPFAGRPIIEYPIELALESQLFDRVIVSTDDPEITQVALRAGAAVPFVRPDALSDDQTGTIDVMRHAIGWVEKNIAPVTNACCLYPTTPFLKTEDLAAGIEKIRHNPEADYAFSVTAYRSSIFRSFTLEPGKGLKMVWPEFETKRSQELPETYHDAGMFYWGTRQTYFSQSRFFTSRACPVILPSYRVHDIDTPEDWERAELVYAALVRRS